MEIKIWKSLTSGSGDGSGGQEEDAVDAEAGEEEEGSGQVEVEWSEWSPCSASCGASTQSRWSRCLDTGNMMDCIQVRSHLSSQKLFIRKGNPSSILLLQYFYQNGGEKRETRACSIVACSGSAAGQGETHLTSEDIERVRRLQRFQQKQKTAPPGQNYEEETLHKGTVGTAILAELSPME